MIGLNVHNIITIGLIVIVTYAISGAAVSIVRQYWPSVGS